MKTTITALALAALMLPATAEEKKQDDGGAKKAPNPARVFKKKDADKDGFLSKDEFTKGMKDADKAAKAFGRKDKDGDGKLSPDEFAAAPAKGGKKQPKKDGE